MSAFLRHSNAFNQSISVQRSVVSHFLVGSMAPQVWNGSMEEVAQCMCGQRRAMLAVVVDVVVVVPFVTC